MLNGRARKAYLVHGKVTVELWQCFTGCNSKFPPFLALITNINQPPRDTNPLA